MANTIDWNAILRSTVGDETLIGAGTFLTTFDPYNPWGHIPTDDEIIATTSSDISLAAVPALTDMFEDVNGAPSGVAEGMKLDRWNMTMTFTSITLNANNIKFALSAADVSTLGNGVKKIKPRASLKSEDFISCWWVCSLSNGGAIAVKIARALSTNGLTITATKTNKGTIAQSVTAYVSASDLSEMPMEFYVIPPEGTTVSAIVRYDLTNATSTEDATSVDIGEAYTTTIAADDTYTLQTVRILMGDTDITADVYNSGTGAVAITAVTADLDIIAVGNTEYNVTNTLTHVTTNNAATKAFDGTSYAATLTVENGYTLDSVTVTMGGVDITDSAFNAESRTIRINSVTGNVVVTATAE